MHQENFVTQLKYWLATSAETLRSKESDHSHDGRQLIRMVGNSRFISTPRLYMGMIGQFRRKLSVWSNVNRLLPVG